MDKSLFSKLFKVGDEIASGKNLNRKNAATIRILAIETEDISYQSVTSPRIYLLQYDALEAILQAFEVNPKSITDHVNDALDRRGLDLDHVTETYSYGIARAYRERAGFSTMPELPSTVQGFNSSAANRKTLENYAVNIAERYFAGLNYAVELHGKPFDLLCTKEAEILYVEVKGTQGSGQEILLTRGEVNFNRDRANKMALFIVSEISISADGHASGGRYMIKIPWTINKNSLSPYAFTYRV